MQHLKRIGVFTRDNDDDVDYRLGSMSRLFARASIETVVLAETTEPGELDLIIALGGDGTVLRALATYPGIPVLAVNFGSLGFLTASDRNDLDQVLVRLLSDDDWVEERLTLEVNYRGEAHRCVNELVIKGPTQMIDVAITINGQTIHTARGDGIIVGTPTGSTGYLLSTGAPIISPDMDSIILKPLNEYSFSSRSILLPGSAQIELKILEQTRARDIIMVIDGGPAEAVSPGETFQISKSPVPARLVYFESDYFFRNLKSRLRW
ncbi:MAG: NAD(+)/NADH kinase [Bradymonadia bacterium]